MLPGAKTSSRVCIRSVRASLPTKNFPPGFAGCLRCRFQVQDCQPYSSKGNGHLQAENPLNSTKPPSGPDRNRLETSSPTSIAGTEQDSKYEKKSEGVGLPSEAERRRSQASKQFTNLMDDLQSNIFIAGQTLNDLTGYSAIEKLKKEIQAQEERVRKFRAMVRQTKEDYTTAIHRRSTSQREVNELLQRKHTWSPADLERFTSLYRSDHANEVAETEAQGALTATERESEEAAALLNKSILSRYHEEQIWSDKIRRMSTWGTWGLMGLNVLLFLVLQVAVEPWRRQRLVRGFEAKVKEVIEQENFTTYARADDNAEDNLALTINHSQGISRSAQTTVGPKIRTPGAEVLQTKDTEISADPSLVLGVKPVTTSPEQVQPSSIAPSLPTHFSFSLKSWTQKFNNLFSDHSVDLTQRDFTTVIIRSTTAGVVAGAAITGILMTVFRPH